MNPLFSKPNLYKDGLINFYDDQSLCVSGESLARAEIFLYLTGLLQKFEFRALDPANPPRCVTNSIKFTMKFLECLNSVQRVHKYTYIGTSKSNNSVVLNRRDASRCRDLETISPGLEPEKVENH